MNTRAYLAALLLLAPAAGCSGTSNLGRPLDTPVDAGAPSTDAAVVSDRGRMDGGREDDAPTHDDDGDAPSKVKHGDDAGDDGAAEAEAGGDARCPESGYAGTLMAFAFAGLPGDEQSVQASAVATGVLAGALSRSPGVGAATGASSINGDDWGLGHQANAARYYTFTVTPPPGCAITVDAISFGSVASATGPADGDVATSADAFDSHSAAFPGTGTGSIALTASSTGALEVRLYGYGATSAEGTLRLYGTMTVSGSIL